MLPQPTLFAVVYSTTVAVHPKAIFNCAAGILIVALFLVSFVRTPKGVKPKKQGERNFEHVERGRSRRTKDLRVEVGVSPGSSASVSR